MRTWICPICDREIIKSGNHIRKHGIPKAEWYSRALEQELGRSTKQVLEDLYSTQRLGSPAVCKQLRITFRVLRDLLRYHGLHLFSISEGVANTWRQDDGTRSQQASKKMRETNLRFDRRGDNSPSKRPEVARKISEAKKVNNPGLIHFRMGNLRRYKRKAHVCEYCGKKYYLKNKSKYANQRFCSRKCLNQYSGPSTIETKLAKALDRARIPFKREYKVGRYHIDFALPVHKVAIEADGEYWHSLKPGHDEKRDRELSNLGWITFRFSEGEINASARNCVKDLIARLQILGIDPRRK